MEKTILESLIDSGVVTESKILFGLHKSGVVDVITLIKETVANIKVRVADMSNVEAIKKLRETASYLEAMACIIEDINNETDVQDEVEQAPDVITVVGSN